MLTKFAKFATVVAVALSKVRTVYPTARIQFGQQALDEQYPYFTRLVITDDDGSKWGCGGALIAPSWVITAAHCAESEDGTLRPLKIDAYVRGSSQPSPIAAAGIDVPSGWSSRGHMSVGDVMMVKLKSPIEGVPTLEFAESLPPPGTKLVIMGQGQTEDPNTERYLRTGETPLLSRKQAMQYLRSSGIRNGIERDHFAAGLGLSDTCAGDSGGPVLFGGSLVGVVSYGYTPCGDPRPVSFFTNGLYYREWVDEVMARGASITLV